MEHLIEKFSEIGFSKNEAKVYITLLRESALNGYEISKKSGVPRSMVYAVIAKLVVK
ncbi:MAG: TrmB family transcriptional regulator, partial [Bacillales bacterium]|nr:TrmB family transcriptional regulator [Bacillales bacterium]